MSSSHPGSTSFGDAPAADVLIVGGGVAGLTAARELMKRKISCRVLEARDRVGGRTYSLKVGRDWLDLGGQWIGPTQDRLAALARELGIETFPQHHQGTKLLSWGGKPRTFKGDIPWLSLATQLELGLMDWRIKSFLKDFPIAEPWTSPRAAEWDGQTVETWKRRHLRTGGARLFLDVVVRAVFTSEPRDLSFLYFLSYLKTGHGLEKLISIKGGAQESRFVGGAQRISNCMAEQLGDRLVLSCPVRSVTQDSAGVVLQTDKGPYRGRLVIIAIPPLLASRIHYSAALPSQREQLMIRMPMGSVIKYIATYERAFWREAGFSGEAFSDTGPRSPRLTTHRMTVPSRRWSASATEAPAGFWGDRPADERRQAVLAEFARFFGPQAEQPTDFVEKNWNEDPWSGGCYAGVMGPGVMTDFGPAIRQPCGRIHWAGTETAVDWTGYIDGAIESGERSAAEVAVRLEK